MEAVMKTKLFSTLFALAVLLTFSFNVLADCGKCVKSQKFCCAKKQMVQEAEKDAKEEMEDQDIPLDKVPEKIKKAAEKAVKDIKLTEAEIEDGLYELKGKVGKTEYEIKITKEGKIVKIEKEDDDDDGEEDDD